MNIKEAEERSGVSKRNIRFYEQKGLLTPIRNRDNDYREYSEADIERLKLIRALRMIDMPLEQVREVVQGKVSMREAVAIHKGKLRTRMKEIETAIRFCDELSAEKAPDLDEILYRMEEPENRDHLPARSELDHIEAVLEIVLPLLAGILPSAVGVIFGIMAVGTMDSLPALSYSVSVMAYLLWGMVGCLIRKRGNWLKNMLLFHVFPLASCGCYLLMVRIGWSMIPVEAMAIFGYFPILFTGLPLVKLVDMMDHMTWVPMVLLVVVFCMGGMCGWLWEHRKGAMKASPA